MKFNEVNKKFNDKVVEYLAKGYILHSATMSGSQGEIAKIDMFKGTELIRIYLDRESIFGRDARFYGDTVVVRVGRWNKELKPNGNNDTVWMSDLEVLEETVYYRVSRYDEWYVDSLEEASAIQEKQRSRYKTFKGYVSDKVNITDDKTKEIAGKYIKRRLGYKRLFWDKIEVYKVYEFDGTFKYVILYNGTTLILAHR